MGYKDFWNIRGVNEHVGTREKGDVRFAKKDHFPNSHFVSSQDYSGTIAYQAKAKMSE